ncbi:MAG: hypothetical protein HW394_1119 [Acidobacteria bacterium]|nr:hypothetical protein [Acidobacteriota bacterium]
MLLFAARWTRRTILKHAIPAVSGAVLALFAVASLSAHHSPSAIFDMGKRIAVTGTLTKIDWINPHIVVSMDARSDGGKIDRWTFESNPPSWYRSVGLARADFAKALGQTVTVEGLPARDGTLFGYMRKITLPDGTSLELVNSVDPK